MACPAERRSNSATARFASMGEAMIVGFDGVPEGALYWPGLTTAKQPSQALGQAACKALMQMIDTPDLFALHLAVLAAGGVAAPISTRAGADELRQTLAIVEPGHMMPVPTVPFAQVTMENSRTVVPAVAPLDCTPTI